MCTHVYMYIHVYMHAGNACVYIHVHVCSKLDPGSSRGTDLDTRTYGTCTTCDYIHSADMYMYIHVHVHVHCSICAHCVCTFSMANI